MKKPILLIVILMLSLLLGACSGGSTPEDGANDRPPAFTVLQKQQKLTKQTEKGESTAFSKDDFETALGEKLTYITVTGLPEAELGTLIFNGAAVTKGQTLPAGSLEYLRFVPAAEIDAASFVFTCDSAGYNGRELVCDIIFTESVNSPPVAADSSVRTVSGITCETVLAVNEPDGDAFTVNVITYPRDGFVTLDESGRVIYTPEDGFSGSDTLVYTVTDRFGAVSERATLLIEVDENESGIYFADMQDNMRHLYAHRMCESDIMVYRIENGSYYFDPDTPVSKIEFLVMMMNASGLDADIVAVADSAVSDDAGLSSGLKGYLSAAAEKGLIKLENGAFSPKGQITVADAAYMVAAALRLPGLDSESVAAGTTDRTFASIMAASNAGFFKSMEPSHTLTKQETAEILCLIRDYMEENNMTA